MVGLRLVMTVPWDAEACEQLNSSVEIPSYVSPLMFLVKTVFLRVDKHRIFLDNQHNTHRF
jgi:hypothetical protein